MTRKNTRNDIFKSDTDIVDMPHSLQQPQDGLREHPGQPRGRGPQLAQRPPRAVADCLTDWLHNPCLHGRPDWTECIPRVYQTWRYDATRAAWRALGVPFVRPGPLELVLAVCQWRARRLFELAVGVARIFILLRVQPSPMEALLFFECINAIQRSPILTAWAPTRWMFRLAS